MEDLDQTPDTPADRRPRGGRGGAATLADEAAVETLDRGRRRAAAVEAVAEAAADDVIEEALDEAEALVEAGEDEAAEEVLVEAVVERPRSRTGR